ncbi:MAG: PQQ-binding-like beta-propeller repeat protein [Bacteroidota bacterium]
MYVPARIYYSVNNTTLMIKKYCSLFVLLFCMSVLVAQETSLVFVHLSDTHVGSGTGAEDLRRTVNDINENPAIQFIVISGDITEFGADEELKLAKQILDSLQKPWHLIPGNHDGNWSESGANSFKKIFGSETFAFQAGKYIFLGTACGPNMRMGPGQIPREDIVWLDSTLKAIPDSTPLIFVNHYPQNDALNNWYEALDRLKQKNIELVICGHGHSNHKLNFEGIPGIMGRSNLRARAAVGGYNIVTIKNDSVTYEERTPGVKTNPPWNVVAIKNHHFNKQASSWPRPSYAVNDSFPGVTEKWDYHDNSDIGSGTAADRGLVFTTNTNGEIRALNKKDGQPAWTYSTNGKIYSIPATAHKTVVAGSSDGYIYSLSETDGRLKWKFQTGGAVLAHPLIYKKTVYIGASDGHFRALRLSDGKLRWDFDGVKGFVVDKPLIYDNRIYFGCWNNDFYCLDLETGTLVWKWNNGSGNRMYSPAACLPAAAHNRVFIVAPDRYMTALDALTGAVIWRKQMPDLRVRESMGLSADSSLVFVKTMEGQVYGISTTAADMLPAWKSESSLGYEICPTSIVEKDHIVFVPGQSGLTVALNRADGKVLWKHKTSNGLVTHLLPLDKHQLLVTTMDGEVSLLQY